jgi:HAD superfamily hydrolase (TIGR01458 family)
MAKAILFDISGVLHVDNQPISGAVDTISKLQKQNVPMRFVTNTSRSTSDDMLSKLSKMGFNVKKEDIFTAPIAMKLICQQKKLRPYCLIHPDLEPEFADLDQSDPNVVVIADAAQRFNYDELNQAFALLMEGAPLLGIGLNRYFKSEGQLQLDAGPFIRALEYAADIEATILGKPSSDFFLTAVDSLGCAPEDVLMIGDDVDADVNGALSAGLQACLVQTGKFLPGDEEKLINKEAHVIGSVADVMALIEVRQERATTDSLG